jgi:MHS family proline/betaine transporter-like MFS transporter
MLVGGAASGEAGKVTIDTRAVVASAIGNTLEWYDFAVFGFFAPVIATQFFPSEDAIAGLINTLGVFAAGYLVRPIGGILFGLVGDRLGRKRALNISIVAMAVPTTLIALLPNHAQIGVAAALLLVVLRLGQGFAVGGEFIGSICYLVEHAPTHRRATYGSVAVIGAVGGMLIGSGVAALLHGLLSAEAIATWGWRLPFLGGLVMGVVGWWLRRTLTESPAFLEILEAGAIERHPFRHALQEMPLRVVRVFAMVALLGVAVYTLFVWMPTYLTQIVTPPIGRALLINTLAMGLMVAMMPLAGRIADRFGAKGVLAVAAAVLALAVTPLFSWIDTGALAAVIVAQTIFAVINGFIQGPTPVALVDAFPTRLRYSAIAVGYNLSMAVFGGTAPLIATYLIHETGVLTSPAWYLAAIAAISLVATLTLRSSSR